MKLLSGTAPRLSYRSAAAPRALNKGGILRGLAPKWGVVVVLVVLVVAAVMVAMTMMIAVADGGDGDYHINESNVAG